MNNARIATLATAGVMTIPVIFQPASAADLPPHSPLRILVVSDEVNPNGLPPEQLTQPGDISAALLNPASGLHLDSAGDGVVEIPTNDLPLATAAISVPPDDSAAYDVVIYFAHRAPNDGSAAENAADQAAFVAAVDVFLQNGGGFVSFHHGFFPGSGKGEMIQSINGGEGSSIAYNTTDGQDVINVAPGHFITTHAIEYPDMVSYSDAALGIPQDIYPFFNNVPDERYTQHAIFAATETVEMLFASNYAQDGNTHLLGFTHQEPRWQGNVVVYQPGEYQPNALDDLEGNNFQVLANAIVYSANAFLECPEDIDRDSKTDVVDFLELLKAWGPCAGYCDEDLNGDGVVAVSDFLSLLEAWGPCQ